MKERELIAQVVTLLEKMVNGVYPIHPEWESDALDALAHLYNLQKKMKNK